MFPIIIKFGIIFTLFNLTTANTLLKQLQAGHRANQLSNAELTHLSNLSNARYTNQILENILIPRVVGTKNHETVFNYIKNELKKLKWHVDVDEFQDVTPKFGTLTFKNIVASLNPNADRYLVLACHYDSKYFESGEFVGATDSAVPCAMLLNLAKVMKEEFNAFKSESNLSLKLIFFDGEEAFVNWGPNDSIYGAKHLANVYHKSVKSISNGETVNDLQKIDVLVLLDLIGHKGTRFHCNFENTQDWYLQLVSAEERLQQLGLLKKSKNTRIFLKKPFYGFIEDDHIPFLQRNVPILHLISHPFPLFWHTLDDNKDVLDSNTIEDINKILRVFVAEYLHLNMLVNDN